MTPSEAEPQGSISSSLGVEGATPTEERIIEAGLSRAALKLLIIRLSDSIPPDERAELDHRLESNDLEGMIAIMRDHFPNYDELQHEAINEARTKVLEKAEAAKSDPSKLGEILKEGIS